MDKRIVGLILGGIIVVAAGAYVVDRFFLPAGTVVLDEAAPDAQAVREGTLRGRDGHSATGTVALIADGDRFLLHFTDLKMTDGPDLYLYVTPSSDPTSRGEIAAGWRVPVVTDADPDQQINERGSFTVALPAAIDIDAIGGIGVWCDRFGVPFATAELTPSK